MDENNIDMYPNTTWLAGASYGGTDAQYLQFLSESIWENSYEDKHFEVIRSRCLGVRIAVTSSYTCKQGLPFDNRGQSRSYPNRPISPSVRPSTAANTRAEGAEERGNPDGSIHYLDEPYA